MTLVASLLISCVHACSPPVHSSRFRNQPQGTCKHANEITSLPYLEYFMAFQYTGMKVKLLTVTYKTVWSVLQLRSSLIFLLQPLLVSFLNMPSSLLPQGLSTYRFLCLDYSNSRCLHGGLLLTFQVPGHMTPFQRGLRAKIILFPERCCYITWLFLSWSLSKSDFILSLFSCVLSVFSHCSVPPEQGPVCLLVYRCISVLTQRWET